MITVISIYLAIVLILFVLFWLASFEIGVLACLKWAVTWPAWLLVVIFLKLTNK